MDGANEVNDVKNEDEREEGDKDNRDNRDKKDNKEEFRCGTCRKTFTSKYTLKTHIERNKKCILARGDEISSEFVCQSCQHISMKRGDFQVHLSNCVKYIMETERVSFLVKLAEKDKLLAERDERIARLEEKLALFERIERIERADRVERIESTTETNMNLTNLNLTNLTNTNTNIQKQENAVEQSVGKRFGLSIRYRDW